MSFETLKNAGEDGKIENIEITSDIINELEVEIKSASEEQRQVLIGELDKAIQKTGDPELKARLIKIKEEKEILSTKRYSLDGLQEAVTDSHSKEFLKLYQTVIGGDLETLYGEKFTELSPNKQETIKLVFWDVIQSQIGLTGGVNIVKGKIGNFLGGFTEIFGEKEEEGEAGTILTKHLREKGDLFSGVAPHLQSDIENTIELVESLIGTEANNLEKLLDLSSDTDNVFQNPYILKAIMKDGKYKKDGFDIDLESGRFITTSISSVPDIQEEFMQDLVDDTQSIGDNVASLKGKADKIDKTLKKLGLGGLDDIKQELFNIPIIGIFFKMILGDFFEKFDSADRLASIERVTKALNNPQQAKTLGDLNKKFIPEFLKKQENLESPLGKVLSGVSEDLYKGLDPFFATLDNAQVAYTDKDFWEKILTGKGGEGTEKAIYSQISSTLKKEDLDEKKLITALNSIHVEAVEASEVVDGNSQEAKPTDATNTDTNKSLAQATTLAGTAIGTNQKQNTSPEPPSSKNEIKGVKTPDQIVAEMKKKEGVQGETIDTGGTTTAEVESVEEEGKGLAISEVVNLPAEIIIPGIENPIKVGLFDTEKKQISLGGILYSFSDVTLDTGIKATNRKLADLEDIGIENGIPFIKAAGEPRKEVETGKLSEVFTALLKNGSYTITSNTENGIPIKIDISKVV